MAVLNRARAVRLLQDVPGTGLKTGFGEIVVYGNMIYLNRSRKMVIDSCYRISF